MEDTEEEGLGIGRKFRDLVQEEGAAVGVFEVALAVFHGAGKGASHVAEEFRVHKLLGKGAAVDHEKRGLAAGAVLVDDARDVLLAHSAFSLNENAEPGRSEFYGCFQGLVEGGIVAYYVIFVF